MNVDLEGHQRFMDRMHTLAEAAEQAVEREDWGTAFSVFHTLGAAIRVCARTWEKVDGPVQQDLGNAELRLRRVAETIRGALMICVNAN